MLKTRFLLFLFLNKYRVTIFFIFALEIEYKVRQLKPAPNRSFYIVTKEKSCLPYTCVKVFIKLQRRGPAYQNLYKYKGEVLV